MNRLKRFFNIGGRERTSVLTSQDMMVYNLDYLLNTYCDEHKIPPNSFGYEYLSAGIEVSRKVEGPVSTQFAAAVYSQDICLVQMASTIMPVPEGCLEEKLQAAVNWVNSQPGMRPTSAEAVIAFLESYPPQSPSPTLDTQS